jgi:Pycsar effector protein
MHIQHPRQELDYLLYETRSQLVSFSQMADTKANILLSISSVLVTISIAKFTDPHFTIPIVILTIFMLGAIFFSLLAVIPSMNIRHVKRKRATDPNFNPLFFGDYAFISYEEYAALMEKILNDSDRVYEEQVREIYFAGKYLQSTKYTYIKYGYVLFFIGVISSVVVYLVQAW